MPISPECDVGGWGHLAMIVMKEQMLLAFISRFTEIQNPAWVHLANEGANNKNDDDITDKLD